MSEEFDEKDIEWANNEPTVLDKWNAFARGAAQGYAPILSSYYDKALEKISGEKAAKEYTKKLEQIKGLGGAGYGAGFIGSFFGPKETELLYDLTKVNKLKNIGKYGRLIEKGAKTGLDATMAGVEGFMMDPGEGGLQKRFENAKDFAKFAAGAGGLIRGLQLPFKKQANKAAFDALNASESKLTKIPEAQREKIGGEFLDRGILGWFGENKVKLKEELNKEKKILHDVIKSAEGTLPKKEMYTRMGKKLRGTLLNPEGPDFNKNLSKFLNDVNEGMNPTYVKINNLLHKIPKKESYTPMETQARLTRANKKYNSKIAEMLEDPFRKTMNEVERSSLREMLSEHIGKNSGKKAQDLYEKTNDALHNLLTGKSLIKEKGSGLLNAIKRNKFDIAKGALGLGVIGSRFMPSEYRDYGTATSLLGMGIAAGVDPRTRAKLLTSEPSPYLIDIYKRLNKNKEEDQPKEFNESEIDWKE